MTDVRVEVCPGRLDAERPRRLRVGAHDNPFAVLGPHDTPDGRVIRAFLPGAAR